MNRRSPSKSHYIKLLPLLMGVIAFLYITGGSIINPLYIDWLLKGDPATHWLGWQFFRYTPIFQWPMGANPDYGLSMGSSIVFTDSIPLLAFIFKPFNQILPEQFQYLGLWIFSCFLLQAFFSWKILSLFTTDKLLPIIGSVFFILSPIALWRLYGHYSLFGHWVLLAGLYFYLIKQFSSTRWLVLLVTTSMIHAYLFLMLLCIWIVDLLQRYYLTQLTKKEILRIFIFSLSIIVFSMWATGYFMLGSNIGADGIYKMNLLSLIDPDITWSYILPDQEQMKGDYEGFNFLGIGIISLLIISLVKLKTSTILYNSSKLKPLIFRSLSLFILSLSNHVAWGQTELFSYTLPDKIIQLFRARGRFFWPVYYIIYISIFYILFKTLKPKSAIILCSFFLLFNTLDMSQAHQYFKTKFSQKVVWQSPLKSPVWDQLSKQYNKIIFVLPYCKPPPPCWIALSKFAGEHNMAINIGYFARCNYSKVQIDSQYITTSIEKNKLDNKAFYIFEEGNNLWHIAIKQTTNPLHIGQLDGFNVLAPNLLVGSLKLVPLIDAYNGEIPIDSVTGSYGRESDGENWWHWVERKVTFHLLSQVAPKDAARTKLAFEYGTKGKQAVTLKLIKFDGSSHEILLQSEENTSVLFETILDVPPIELDKISIEINGKASPLGNGDPRVVALFIRNLSITVALNQ